MADTWNVFGQIFAVKYDELSRLHKTNKVEIVRLMALNKSKIQNLADEEFLLHCLSNHVFWELLLIKQNW